MHKLSRYYKLANILSLDVVAGAVICSIFFSQVFNTVIRVSGIISLALSVWIIYTVDHLLDARRIAHQASTARHRFHQKHQKILYSVLLLALLVVASQLYFIRKPVLTGGMILSAFIIIYFFVQKHLKYLKELFGAFLYAGGVLLIPLSLKFESLNTPYVLLLIQFLLTVLINLLLFSWFDFEQDTIDYRQSFVTTFGDNFSKKILVILFIASGIFFVFLVLGYPCFGFASTIILIMNLVLASLFVNKNYFIVNDRYRILGDAVFLIPLLYNFSTWL